MKKTIPDHVLLLWEQELFTAQGDKQSQLEWLGSALHKRSTGAVDAAVAKLRCRSRRPSRLRTLRESTRTVELACFLRHALLITNDTIISLCDMRGTDLRRQAQELANTTERIELQEIRSLLSRTRQCAE